MHLSCLISSTWRGQSRCGGASQWESSRQMFSAQIRHVVLFAGALWDLLIWREQVIVVLEFERMKSFLCLVFGVDLNETFVSWGLFATRPNNLVKCDFYVLFVWTETFDQYYICLTAFVFENVPPTGNGTPNLQGNLGGLVMKCCPPRWESSESASRRTGEKKKCLFDLFWDLDFIYI